MGKVQDLPPPKKGYYEPPKEETYMVSSLGTGMSGISINDRDDVTIKAKKFSSHEQFENTYDDRELTGKGTYYHNYDDEIK